MYLLDTNTISEIRKIGSTNNRNKANKGVYTWASTTNPKDFFISTISILEIQKGMLLKQRRDPVQAKYIEDWLISVISSFNNRILHIDLNISLQCAKLHIPNPRPQFDSLIAATALTHNLILVTRNVQDFEHINNLSILNPFT